MSFDVEADAPLTEILINYHLCVILMLIGSSFHFTSMFKLQ